MNKYDRYRSKFSLVGWIRHFNNFTTKQTSCVSRGTAYSKSNMSLVFIPIPGWSGTRSLWKWKFLAFFCRSFSLSNGCFGDNLPPDVTANVEKTTPQFHHQLAENDEQRVLARLASLFLSHGAVACGLGKTLCFLFIYATFVPYFFSFFFPFIQWSCWNEIQFEKCC